MSQKTPNSMSARAEAAIQQLYEDANLRDELTDDEAQPLLKWAEGQIARLDTDSANDAAFESSADELRRLLKAVNRFVGRRAYATPEEQVEGLAKIAEHTQPLGFALPPERQTAFLQSQVGMDNQAALSALFAEIAGSNKEAQADAAPIPAPVQETAHAKLSPVQQLGDWLRSRISLPQTTIENSDSPNNLAAGAGSTAIDPPKDEPSSEHDPSSGEPF